MCTVCENGVVNANAEEIFRQLKIIKHKTQAETDRKIEWAIQKSIPSFRTQSLRMATGLPPWDPVAVKVFSDFTRVATPFYDQSLARPKVVFLVGLEPAQCHGR